MGMAQGWLGQSECAREAVDQASEVLGFDLGQLMVEGPEAELNDTFNAQPAILSASVAILRAVSDDLPRPDFVAGHSMGEYSALVAVGALGYEDALRLVRERGRLMRQAGEQRPGKMAAVLGLPDADVRDACASVSGVQVANYNAPGQVVISGTEAGVEAAAEALKSGGAKKIVTLAVSIAAHSELMRPVADEFAERVQSTPMAAPSTPILMNASAEATTDPDEIKVQLAAQLTSPVRWTDSIQLMRDAGVDTYFEVGPGRVLTGLVRRIARTATGNDVHVHPLAEPPDSESTNAD